uniref:Uncharacterized protein n=1 Tax=Meloidogyne enterolobii TaxID=390850 RepID=A0A6V7TXX9_MELEN|nr:unnamed protein product [Meloidogyne enterolobii]
MSLPNSSHKLTDPPFLKKKKPLHRFRLSYLRVISKGTGSYSIGVDSRAFIPPSYIQRHGFLFNRCRQ